MKCRNKNLLCFETKRACQRNNQPVNSRGMSESESGTREQHEDRRVVWE